MGNGEQTFNGYGVLLWSDGDVLKQDRLAEDGEYTELFILKQLILCYKTFTSIDYSKKNRKEEVEEEKEDELEEKEEGHDP